MNIQSNPSISKSGIDFQATITLFKSTIILILMVVLNTLSLKAQSNPLVYNRPSWYFGLAGAANISFYRGSTKELNPEFKTPSVFHKGIGLGLYLAPLIEYYRPNTRLGMMLQFGYDGRSGKFAETLTPCNCPSTLNTKLSYFTIEPSLRFAPFKSGFYIYGGPRFAFNMDHSFTYKQEANPDYPNQTAPADVKGYISDMESTLISMQIGAGYDIFLSPETKKTQFVLSPFVSFQPYYGQSPRSKETWNITTLRVGAALKFGFGSIKNDGNDDKTKVSEITNSPITTDPTSPIRFTVRVPENISTVETVKEIFPLRNYVFFDLGSTEIPKRYTSIKKSEVSKFNKDQIKLSTPENLAGRPQRQMIVYYNILNILGDRMNKLPTSTITLIGSSEEGNEDGLRMAEKIKTYLVDVFGINANRIKTEGSTKPKLPSEQPGQTKELELLREGDRRVSIESSNSALFAPYESSPSKFEKKSDKQSDSIASLIQFNNAGSNQLFSSWSLEFRDQKGGIQKHGPFQSENTSIPIQKVLGSKTEGTYKITMIGIKPDGKSVTRDTTVFIKTAKVTKNIEVTRYSIIYEFDASGSTVVTEKYLTEVVLLQIPKGATILIHGFTDVIGDTAYNQKLSVARANDVRKILEDGLAKNGRTDVQFETHGHGEDEKFNQFNNQYPEERFYNRSVIIDILTQL